MFDLFLMLVVGPVFFVIASALLLKFFEWKHWL